MAEVGFAPDTDLFEGSFNIPTQEEILARLNDPDFSATVLENFVIPSDQYTEAAGGLAGTFLKNKAAEKQAVHESKMRRIDADADWETQQAAASQSSWKDEWFAIILSLPLIGAFIPSMVPYVEQGFTVLSTMPDYYKAFLGGAIAASFGIKTLSSWGGK